VNYTLNGLYKRSEYFIVAHLDLGEANQDSLPHEGDVIGCYSKPVSYESSNKSFDFTLDFILGEFDIHFSDSQGDFVTPPGGTPPNGVFPYPPIDVLKISLKKGDENLYIKCEVCDTIPIREEIALGEEENEEERYATHSEAAIVNGGLGYDLILLAYPLDEVEFPINQTISFLGAFEAESNKWHHFSFDQIPLFVWEVYERR